MEHILEAIQMLKDDKWEQAHQIAQDDPTEVGAWLHGIVHMIEGDEFNAQYWYQRAHRSFPGMKSVKPEIESLALRVKNS